MEKKSWLCLVCGYVHDGDEPPGQCPLCGAPPTRFARQLDGRIDFEDQQRDGEKN
ncbi:hypothetical protein GF377_06470 [candidate division GN15 bacterium]|nr:hypothetical protein [candidate division GN15 bacterium]